MNWHRTFVVARTDVKQLVLAKDFWMPMGILGSIFFVFVPLTLLLSITSLGDVEAVRNVADTLEVLPAAAQEQIRGDTPQGRTSYALAVFLFAPMAVVVPLTISTAVGAATLVGERERGTVSSWPTPQPAPERSTSGNSSRPSYPATSRLWSASPATP